MKDSENKVQMVAGEKSKQVMIKTLRDIRLSDGTIVKPGTQVAVSEEEAKEFCDTVFRGPHAFAGERYGEAEEKNFHQIRRAVRV